MTKGRLIRRILVPAALVAGIVGAAAAPAGAFPTGPSLTVISFRTFAPDGTIIGQKWFGCPGQQGGSWGVQSGPETISFVAC
jgi:hypothetical protein